jgi:hypothetical protein
MGMATEISVRIKTDDKRMTKKFLVYDEYHLDTHDPIIERFLSETIKEFGDTDQEKDITITAKLEV